MNKYGTLTHSHTLTAPFGLYVGTPEPKKVKTKKFYHTFPLGEFDERVITLCLLVTSGLHDEELSHIRVGYSVAHPNDDYNETLGKKIALGRAEKAFLDVKSLPTDFAFNNGVLKAWAWVYERKIKDGELTIKGIRDVE